MVDSRSVPAWTIGWAMPATTWALVTTTPGATTKPDPSWIWPQPSPTTFTVEAPAWTTASLSWVPPGRSTGPADAGASWANTGGNPSAERKLWTRENTDGGAGSTLSSDRMILDRSMEELRASEELLTRVLARSQAASREATTATTTPRAESTVPRVPRWTRLKARLPMIRPDHSAQRGHAQQGHQGEGGSRRTGCGPT